MGGEGGNLGPDKFQTSNVLQIMECVVFSCGVLVSWLVGFCGFFCLLPGSVLFLLALK